MSKNLFKKGLALASASALTLAGLVGVSSPANAAETMTLAPDVGTSYSVLSTTAFTVNAGFPTGITNDSAALIKYKVTTTDLTKLSLTAKSAGNSDADLGENVLTAGTTAVYSENESWASALGATQSLTVSTSERDADSTVTVQAFLDLDGDDDISGNDPYTPARTITFVDSANVTAVTEFDAPQLGDATLTAYVTLSGLNMEQVGRAGNTDVTVAFKKDNVDVTSFANAVDAGADGSVDGTTPAITNLALVTANPNSAVFDSTSKKLMAVFTPTNVTSDAAAAAVNNNPLSVTTGVWGSVTEVVSTGSTYATSGTVVNYTVAAAEVVAINVSASPASGVKTSTKGVQAGSGDVLGVIAVRDDVKSFSVLATFLDADAGDPVAGATVRATISSSNLLTADGATVNGKALTSSAAVTLNLVTDAKGQVKVDVAATAADATDDVVFNFSSQGVATSSGSNQGQTTATWTAATYTLHNLSDLGAAARTIAVGGNVSVDYSVVDQWGDGIGSGHVVYVTRATNSGRAGSTDKAASWAIAAPINGTRATASITDNGAGTGSDTVTAEVRKVLGSGFSSALDITNTSDHDQFTVTYAASHAPAFATVAVANDGSSTAEPLNVASVFANYDQRVDVLTSAPAAATSSSDNVITVTVTQSNGSAYVNGPVTISAPGLMFTEVTAGSVTVYKIGSITTYTDGSGVATVTAYGQKAGDATVTATAGSVKATKVVKYAAAAADTGAKLTVVGQKSIKAGRTLRVGVQLVDKFGNPVALTSSEATTQQFALSYDGPGFVINNVTSLDASGSGSVRILLGSNETGPAVFTFSYVDLTGATPAAANSNTLVTASSATWVGPIANATAGAKKGNVVVDVYRAKGKTVKVYVGKTLRATFVADAVNDKFVLKGVKSGARNLKVRLSGPGEDFSGAISVK